jgi:hypothetical protein
MAILQPAVKQIFLKSCLLHFSYSIIYSGFPLLHRFLCSFSKSSYLPCSVSNSISGPTTSREEPYAQVKWFILWYTWCSSHHSEFLHLLQCTWPWRLSQPSSRHSSVSGCFHLSCSLSSLSPPVVFTAKSEHPTFAMLHKTSMLPAAEQEVCL